MLDFDSGFIFLRNDRAAGNYLITNRSFTAFRMEEEPLPISPLAYYFLYLNRAGHCRGQGLHFLLPVWLAG